MNNATNYSAESTLAAVVTHPCQRFLLLAGVAALLTGCGAGGLQLRAE